MTNKNGTFSVGKSIEWKFQMKLEVFFFQRHNIMLAKGLCSMHRYFIICKKKIWAKSISKQKQNEIKKKTKWKVISIENKMSLHTNTVTLFLFFFSEWFQQNFSHRIVTNWFPWLELIAVFVSMELFLLIIRITWKIEKNS